MKIEEKVISYFKENGLWLASAESCTGGLISKRITDISGSSAIFGYGLCTYANSAKVKLLGVCEETLKQYGAVSKKTAQEMAKGLLALSEADVAICTTGMASPGGETTDKPVGMVFVGIASKLGVKTFELSLGHLISRDKIRNASADFALQKALEEAMEIVRCRNS